MIQIRKPKKEEIPELISLWREQYDYHHSLDPDYYVPNSDELDVQLTNI